ncbi:MAG: hypothetical protein WKG00_05040 [Polyangiaceae bacterium]
MIVLNEDPSGAPPGGDDAGKYAAAVKVSIPVLADGLGQLLQKTPWDGAARPGKCVLSPRMEMLRCYVGEDDTDGFAAIEAHAAGQ